MEIEGERLGNCKEIGVKLQGTGKEIVRKLQGRDRGMSGK